VELHKLQARKRTALISTARFGRTVAFQEDACLAGLPANERTMATEAHSRPVVGSRPSVPRDQRTASTYIFGAVSLLGLTRSPCLTPASIITELYSLAAQLILITLLLVQAP
jgi:hypothetical protein